MLRKHLKTIAAVAGFLCATYVGYYFNTVVHVGDRDVRFIGVSVLIIVVLFVVTCLPLMLRWAEHDARRKVLKEQNSGQITRVHEALRARDRWASRPSGLGSTYRPEHQQPVVQIPAYMPADMSDTAVLNPVRKGSRQRRRWS